MGMSLSILFVFGALLGSGPAAAYTVPTHEKLTRRASELLQRCGKYGVALPAPDSQVTRILRYYNAKQDDWLNKLALWHFPNVPQGEECPGPFPSCLFVIERSFEPWTNHIWEQVQATLPPDQLYPALGAALHYVQDMAVPAHAIPVFHPEGLLHLFDGLDEYEAWNNAFSYPEQGEMAGVCRRLVELSQHTSLPELLLQVRESTLRSLNETFGSSTPGTPFHVLWQPRDGSYQCTPEKGDLDEGLEGCSVQIDNDQGFGSYGCDGDFGDDELQCGWHEYHVDRSDYDRYAGRRARDAIFYSAATILLFQSKLAPCRRAGCKPDKGADDWIPTRSRIKALREP